MTELALFAADAFPDQKIKIREYHGLSDHPIHKTWKRMIARCYVSSVSHFDLYGGRGIRVCARWHRFSNFFNDMISSWKSGMSLDRIDPDGHYHQENCRWATFRTQIHNRRRNLDVEFRGETRKLSELAEQLSVVDYPTLYQRVKAGWEIEAALSTPPQKTCKRRRFVVDGVEYASIRGCARALNINSTAVYSLLRNGRGHYL